MRLNPATLLWDALPGKKAVDVADGWIVSTEGCDGGLSTLGLTGIAYQNAKTYGTGAPGIGNVYRYDEQTGTWVWGGICAEDRRYP